MNRNTLHRVTAAVLCAGLACGILGTSIQAAGTSVPDTPATTAAPAVSAVSADDAGPFTKDETVYVFADAAGSTEKVLVSSWLQNTQRAAVLVDSAQLDDVENVKGDESYTLDSEGRLVWQANGSDIYYQGTTQKDLPVQLQVRYTLNGKELSPAELAGQSGKVTIRFAYHNTQRTTAKINGKAESIPVPFTVLTVLMLDDDVFHNVQVTNGKLENLGSQTAVVGLAFPGMQEGLDVDPADLTIPDYVEVTADVENFSLNETLSLVTTALLQDLDLDHLDLGDLTDSMDELESGVNQLLDGSHQLADGLNTLLEQSNLLVDGIHQLADGSAQLKTGASALQQGAAQLQAGTQQLHEGLTTLHANSPALNAGAEQVFQTLLSTANTQLAAAGLDVPALTIANYADVLNGVIASLDADAVYQTALQQVTAGVEAKRGEITAAVTAAVEQQVTAQVAPQVVAAVQQTVQQQVEANRPAFQEAVVKQALGEMGITSWEQYQAAVEAGLVSEAQQAAIADAITAAMAETVTQQMESEAVQAQIAAITQQKTAEQMATAEMQTIIAQNTEAQVQKAIADTMQSPEVQAQLAAAAAGAKAVMDLKTSLDSYNAFYLGLQTYTAGVGTALEGATQLLGGSAQLKEGTATLCDGTQQLDSGVRTMQGKAPQLIDGVTQLRDGAGQLADGLDTLMAKGISQLLNLTQHDLSGLADRLNATMDAADCYHSFTGAPDTADCAVKFIYKTAPITA